MADLERVMQKNAYLFDLSARLFDQPIENIRIPSDIKEFEKQMPGLGDMFKEVYGISEGGAIRDFLLRDILEYLTIKPEMLWNEIRNYLVENGIIKEFNPLRREIKRQKQLAFDGLTTTVDQVLAYTNKHK